MLLVNFSTFRDTELFDCICSCNNLLTLRQTWPIDCKNVLSRISRIWKHVSFVIVNFSWGYCALPHNNKIYKHKLPAFFKSTNSNIRATKDNIASSHILRDNDALVTNNVHAILVHIRSIRQQEVPFGFGGLKDAKTSEEKPPRGKKAFFSPPLFSPSFFPRWLLSSISNGNRLG